MVTPTHSRNLQNESEPSKEIDPDISFYEDKPSTTPIEDHHKNASLPEKEQECLDLKPFLKA